MCGRGCVVALTVGRLQRGGCKLLKSVIRFGGTRIREHRALIWDGYVQYVRTRRLSRNRLGPSIRMLHTGTTAALLCDATGRKGRTLVYVDTYSLYDIFDYTSTLYIQTNKIHMLLCAWEYEEKSLVG